MKGLVHFFCYCTDTVDPRLLTATKMMGICPSNFTFAYTQDVVDTATETATRCCYGAIVYYFQLPNLRSNFRSIQVYHKAY